MLILFSPAKRLEETSAVALSKKYLPHFFADTQHIEKALSRYTPKDLIKLQGISATLAEQNVERNKKRFSGLQNDFFEAIYLFRGDAYIGLDAPTLKPEAIGFAQKHLRILSGLYGILKPLDHIAPYRLEMGTPITVGNNKSLYTFWQDKLTAYVAQEFSAVPILNLASNEYSKVLNRKKLANPFIDVTFKDRNAGGVYRVMSYYAKKARGMMARFILENQLVNPEDVVHFNSDGYQFSLHDSTPSNLVFLRDH